MSIDKILVIVFGTVAIAFIYWFFLGKRKGVSIVGAVADNVDVRVEGGYSPEVVQVPLGITTTINFTRTDPTGCLEEIVMSDFKIRRTLPLNEKVSVQITPKQKGVFTYSCGMNMYHGKVIVA